MHVGLIAAQSVVMHAVQVVVMLVALSATVRLVRHVRRDLIARCARVRMIVRSGANRLKAARPFANC